MIVCHRCGIRHRIYLLHRWACRHHRHHLWVTTEPLKGTTL